MGSHYDANRAFRVGRYHAPPVPRRHRARVKAGRVILVFAVLSVAMIRVAYGGGRTGTERISVQPGQTVWSIAEERYPGGDVRQEVAQIVSLNNLGSGAIYPGETLKVPAR